MSNLIIRETDAFLLYKEKGCSHQFLSNNTKYYRPEKKDFLKPETTVSEVSKIKSDVEAIKASSVDFNIKDAALPKKAKDIASQKESLSKQLLDASDKLRIQADTDELFNEKVPNWQKSSDDLQVKEDLKAEEVSEVKEKLVFFEESDWQKLADHYLTFAADQVELINEVDKKIKELLKEETVVTYEDYTALLNQIKTVKNEKKKAEFEKSSDKIAERIGLVQEETETSETTDTTEETTDVDTYDENTDIEENNDTYTEQEYYAPATPPTQEQTVTENYEEAENQTVEENDTVADASEDTPSDGSGAEANPESVE